MAINRAPFNALVDDSGNGLTGSIWNKAAIQNVLLDPIDAADAAIGSTAGPWTPNDASGAGLVFAAGTAGLYITVGKLVFLWGQVQFPATSNGLQVRIGGLPFQNQPSINLGFHTTYGRGGNFHLPANGTFMYFFQNSGLAYNNSDLSSIYLIFQGTYFRP
jgi:hypothetical protein